MTNSENITNKKQQYKILIFGYDPDNDKLLKCNYQKEYVYTKKKRKKNYNIEITNF